MSPSYDEILTTNPNEQYCVAHDIIYVGRCPECEKENDAD